MSRQRPLYSTLLHLQHLHPGPVQRFLLGEGALALAGLIVLADLASAWLLLALPVAVAVLVKTHDLLAGRLRARPARPGDQAAPRPVPPYDEPARTELADAAGPPRGGDAPDPRGYQPVDVPGDQAARRSVRNGLSPVVPRPASRLPDLRRSRRPVVPSKPPRREGA